MRPTKLTRRCHARICKSLRLGNSRAVAAMTGGVTLKTLNRWLTRGDDPEETDPRYARFMTAVTFAELTAEATITQHLMTAAEKNWRAAAWYLERRHPERWGKTAGGDAEDSRVEFVVQIGGKRPSDGHYGQNN